MFLVYLKWGWRLSKENLNSLYFSVVQLGKSAPHLVAPISPMYLRI